MLAEKCYTCFAGRLHGPEHCAPTDQIILSALDHDSIRPNFVTTAVIGYLNKRSSTCWTRYLLGNPGSIAALKENSWGRLRLPRKRVNYPTNPVRDTFICAVLRGCQRSALTAKQSLARYIHLRGPDDLSGDRVISQPIPCTISAFSRS